MTYSKDKSLTVFFPMRNEESNIDEVLYKASVILPTLCSDYEIIIVDDGSTDRTGEIAEQYARRDPRVRCVHHPSNRGYGAALQSGFQSARKQFIFFSDGDNQFDLFEIKKLLDLIDDVDIVIGYRKYRADPWYRKLNAFGFNLLVKVLFGLYVKDVDCAFKLFRREIFDKIQVDSLGALVNTEILIKARKQNFKIKETAVRHFSRLTGVQSGANPKVIFRAFREIIKLWGKLR